MTFRIIILILAIFSTNFTYSQIEKRETLHEEGENHLSIEFMSRFAPISEAGEPPTGYILVPAYGFSYGRHITNRFSLGVELEAEIVSTIIVESGHEDDAETEAVWNLYGVAYYRIWRNLYFIGGPGVKLEPGGSFFSLRAILEYHVDFHEHWNVKPIILYDYSALGHGFAFGIGVGVNIE